MSHCRIKSSNVLSNRTLGYLDAVKSLMLFPYGYLEEIEGLLCSIFIISLLYVLDLLACYYCIVCELAQIIEQMPNVQ